jgi:GNAT superfamily N-acetyltransferase
VERGARVPPGAHGGAVSDPAEADTPAVAPTRAWHVRSAHHGDIPAVARAIRELLLELDGTPCAAPAMEDVARALIDSPWEGTVLVAQADVAIVGVLAASWQMAIHVPGTYALIQDLWVDQAWRSQAVGAALVEALVEHARGRHLERVEVGLPRESFARFGATEAFYLSNGFTPNGPRMRRAIP